MWKRSARRMRYQMATFYKYCEWIPLYIDVNIGSPYPPHIDTGWAWQKPSTSPGQGALTGGCWGPRFPTHGTAPSWIESLCCSYLCRYLYQDFNGIILKVCCIGTPVWIYSGILHAGWGLPPPSPGCMTPAISFYAGSCPNTEHRGGGPGTRQREENRAVKEPSRRLHSARGRSLLVSTPGWKCRILALSQSRIYWDTMLLRCFNTVSKCEIWTQTQWS